MGHGQKKEAKRENTPQKIEERAGKREKRKEETQARA